MKKSHNGRPTPVFFLFETSLLMYETEVKKSRHLFPLATPYIHVAVKQYGFALIRDLYYALIITIHN